MTDRDPYHAAHEDNRILEHWRRQARQALKDLARIRLLHATQEPDRRVDDTGFCPGGRI